jgi:hypothetical protein
VRLHLLTLIRHCVDGDVDATLVAATEAHVDDESTANNTTTTTATVSSSAGSSDVASAAPITMAKSHIALVLSVCLLAFSAYTH